MERPGSGHSFGIRAGTAAGILAAVLAGAATAWGAGGSTHFQIADLTKFYVDRTAYPDLYELVARDHPIVFRHASYFPDWGYVRAETNEYGEAAHWPPFQEAAVDYHRRNYPEPWDDRAAKVFAYILGLTSHGEADDAWHFGDTAFLNVANENDHVTPGQLRSDVEIGTDIFVQVEKRWWFPERPRWWVPVEDLAAIYAEAGYPEVTVEMIEFGVAMLHAAVVLEDTMGWTLYLPFKLRLPWTHGNYVDWWDGGVRNDAELTAIRLAELWDDRLGEVMVEEAGAIVNRPGTRVHPLALLPRLAAELVADEVIALRMSREGPDLLLDPPAVLDRWELERRLAGFAGDAGPWIGAPLAGTAGNLPQW